MGEWRMDGWGVDGGVVDGGWLGGEWWVVVGQWGVLISAEHSDICQIIVYIPSGRTQNPETLLL